MKKALLLVVCTVCLLFVSQSVHAITINLLQNGNFEDGGGSFANWNIYGDVDLITDGSNHFARLGGDVNTANSLMSQGFTIMPWYTEQTLLFDYNFTFMVIPTTWSSVDVFATQIMDNNGLLVETSLLLASYDYASNMTGNFNALLNPQLDAGEYYLKFRLNESSGSSTDSVVDLDNVALMVTTTSVPEPSILLFLGSALLGAATISRGLRKKERKLQ